MINKLKLKSEFTKNVLTLMTGTTIAQTIPIAVSPILTRLYTPKDFGVFAIFIVIISIFGSIVNARYELAIILPRKDEDAINILALGFVINVVLSFLLLFVVIIFHDNILNLLNNKEISIWLYLIPISVFLVGCFNLLNYFNNRKKFYKELAQIKVYKTLINVIIQLSFGFFKAGVFGLVSGQIFSQIFSNIRLLFKIKKLNLFQKISKIKMIILGKRYKKFPIFQLPANFMNLISHHAISILLTTFYNSVLLGYYYLAQKILIMPSSLIGNSVKQVFFQELSLRVQKRLSVRELFINITFKLFFIFLPITTIVEFFIEDIITFVFGEKWIYTAYILKILIIFFWIRFVVSPLFSVVLIVFEKQNMSLIVNIILFLTNLGAFVFLHSLKLLDLLFYYGIIFSVEYLLFYFYTYFLIYSYEKKVKKKDDVND